jgi:cytochrome c-type biogenesis protein
VLLREETLNISLFLAFGAGLLSFASPCVLPLVPAYLGHLTGRALVLPGVTAARRWTTFLHALAFVLGFSVVFTVLGASVGLVGYLFYDLLSVFEKVGGLVLIIFGLHTMGLLKIPFLYRELRLQADLAGRWGILSSSLVGAIFAAAWTPCVGPVLSGILILAGTTGTVGRGALLLFVYSLGLGLPFLLAGMSLGWSNALFGRLKRHGRAVSVLSGILLVVMGVLVFTNALSMLSAYLSRYFLPPL